MRVSAARCRPFGASISRACRAAPGRSSIASTASIGRSISGAPASATSDGWSACWGCSSSTSTARPTSAATRRSFTTTCCATAGEAPRRSVAGDSLLTRSRRAPRFANWSSRLGYAKNASRRSPLIVGSTPGRPPPGIASSASSLIASSMHPRQRPGPSAWAIRGATALPRPPGSKPHRRASGAGFQLPSPEATIAPLSRHSRR